MDERRTQVRAALEPMLESYDVDLIETDSSLKLSFRADSGLDPNMLQTWIAAAGREETPGPWVFTFAVSPID